MTVRQLESCERQEYHRRLIDESYHVIGAEQE